MCDGLLTNAKTLATISGGSSSKGTRCCSAIVLRVSDFVFCGCGCDCGGGCDALRDASSDEHCVEEEAACTAAGASGDR
jgi:hypothetical protein